MGRKVALLILGLAPSVASAQSSRSAVLYGSVLTDPNDRLVAGAEVVLSESLDARTDAGDFVINAVPPVFIEFSCATSETPRLKPF